MNQRQILDEILAMLSSVREDKEKLLQIHRFLKDTIYEELEKQEISIPKKFSGICNEIAQSVDIGEICFFNTDTSEFESIHKDILNDPDEFYEITGEKLELKHPNWKHYIEIKPPEYSESFEIMENFTNNIMDLKLKEKLHNSLNNRKPFANFKWLIDHSNFREEWFIYKQKQLEIYVYNEIINGLKE